MKKLIIAKNIGFCFGVKRAVETAEKLLETISSLYTIGNIVHNPLVIEKLKKRGLVICNSIEEIKGKYFIVRSHGLSKKEIEKLKKENKKIFDMTCPFVKRIHYLVENWNKKGHYVIIIGNKNHPEVLGIKGYGAKVEVLEDKEDVEKIKNRSYNKILIVGQTTLNFKKYLEVIENIMKKISASEILVLNTICKITEEREKEAMKIAQDVDAVLVLGGKESSNTKKLYKVCKKICKNTFYIEKFLDLNKIHYDRFKSIGIVSGTSTPYFFIDEVVKYFKKNKYKEVL
ncbi:MAG: 4-hydroxy-3-methylbut-2-enyl diphosphate reductase [Candidatus Omnitrophica bacterium]|nr:4-hydroxy-3-methylbut-2-enyl diphosphate reductase [Candidatus Omnitrophota bacterium]